MQIFNFKNLPLNKGSRLKKETLNLGSKESRNMYKTFIIFVR